MKADAAPAAACAGILICPVCGEPLTNLGRTLRCPRRHAFDRAKEGYVHLLPSGHGRSALSGDPRAMVRAREAFLARGHYEPISDAINARVGAALTRDGDDAARPLALLEAGCGVGYYIGRLSAALPTARGARACSIGVDVSKEALRSAARAHERVCFLVNDLNHRICAADASIDGLLNVFAPRNVDEFARIVRPGGLLLVAVPHEAHLAELRQRLPLLDIEPDKRERTLAQLGDAFVLESEDTVEYRRELSAEGLVELLRMTPNYWHLDDRSLAQVAAGGGATVTIGVLLLAFGRRDTAGTT